MKYWWLLPAFVVAGLAQSRSAWIRQDPYWVRTETGTIASPASGKVRIVAPGPILVQGETRKDIGYTWICGVKTDSEASAQSMLKPAWRTVVSQGEWQAQFRGCPEGKLSLSVPRQLQHTVLETACGRVEANDLAGALDVTT